MKTQIDIRKSKKWAILFIVLMALSASMYAQPAVKSGYDQEVVSMVEQAWNNLDQLAVRHRVIYCSMISFAESITGQKR